MNINYANNKLFWIKTIIISFLFSAVFSIFIQFFSCTYTNCSNFNYTNFLDYYICVWKLISIKQLVFLFIFVFLIILFTVYILKAKGISLKKIFDFIYKYRWPLMILVFLLFLLFCISCSSLLIWSDMLPSSEKQGLIFGVPRSIRSDEYGVNTPMAFSQYADYNGPFSYFGHVVRADKTDMFIVYGQPVFSFAGIFRPSHLGYILFGPQRGLAYFWGFRLLILFMAVFELGMLITKHSKTISFAFACLVTLSPAIQWWFAVNGLVEMLAFGSFAIIIIDKYMRTTKLSYKILLSLGLVYCLLVFILTFYPAWQLPLAYVFLALLIWVIIKNKKNYSFHANEDIPIILGAFILLSILTGLIFIKSWETIYTVLSTDYPGSRIDNGGGVFSIFFSGPAVGLFSPWVSGFDATNNADILINQVESAMFFDFFPLAMLLPLWIIIKEKTKDALLIILLILDFIFMLYCFFGFPDFLINITLMKYTTSSRTALILGFINLIIIIRSAYLLKTRFKPLLALLISFIISFVYIVCVRLIIPNFMIKQYCLIFGLVLLIGILLIIMIKNKYISRVFAVYSLCLAIALGAFINPIQLGAQSIYNNPLVKKLQYINDEHSGQLKWLVISDNVIFNNLPIIVGGPTINSTNVYPDLQRWEKLDPSKKYKEIYNRYAHISFVLQNETESWFELNFLDHFTVHLNVNDLKLIEVSYILTDKELSIYDNMNAHINLVDSEGNYKIYHVSY